MTSVYEYVLLTELTSMHIVVHPSPYRWRYSTISKSTFFAESVIVSDLDSLVANNTKLLTIPVNNDLPSLCSPVAHSVPVSTIAQNVDIQNSTSSSPDASVPTFPISPTSVPTPDISDGYLSPNMDPVQLRGDGFKAVVNLSSRILSDTELGVLSKGLSFCPVPNKVDILKLKQELKDFERNIRLREYYYDPSTEQPPVTEQSESICNSKLFKPKSTFTPKANRNKELDTYLSTLTNEIVSRCESTPSNSFHRNLSKEERKSIGDLKSYHDIVFKDADKGSAVVVMDRARYIREALRHLSDDTTYVKLDHDPTSLFTREIKSVVQRLKSEGVLTKEQFDFALRNESKPARFYLLPKLHKNGVPGRPVVSSCGCITENISIIVDWFLKPLISSIPSYIRDTKDFLQKIRNIGPLPEDALLVTLDVVALYPSIPIDDGLSALSTFLEEKHFNASVRSGIVKLARLVLTKNFFEFDRVLYKQISGTAIGTVMAVCYSIIYMHVFECQAISAHHLKPYLWLRFIDDIFAIWTHGEQKLLDFVTYLNAIHPSMKFTVNYSPVKVHFLDVEVSVSAGDICTDLYVKPTDTHQYLLASSCHPNHIKSSIAYSQALRILSICSSFETAKRRCMELENYLILRGHSKRKVRTSINKALYPATVPRTITTSSIPMPLIVTFHPGLPNIKDIMRELHPILSASPSLREIFPDPFMLSFRRPANLRDQLVRAKLPDIDTVGNAVHACGPCLGDPRCKICELIPCQTFVQSKSGQQFRLFCGPHANCNSKQVIYVLSCVSCGLQYVGQTSNLRLRINNHKSCIANGRVPRGCFRLYDHFAQGGHDGFTVTIVDRCPSGNLNVRESHWIAKLNSIHPTGLNSVDVN